MNSLCTDIGVQSLNKYGETLCGDHVEVLEKEDGQVILVLADGLGSGVKASILSTLTAKIISTMMAGSMSLEECVAAIAATLPVCDVRKIAYSTFTILRVVDGREAEIIQYDNPHVVFLRDGRHVDYPVTTETVGGKVIYKTRVRLQENDTFIAMSDGAIHAGVGKALNFGWLREDIIAFMEGLYSTQYTAKTLTTVLLEQCNLLYEGQPGDDTTVCTVRLQPRKLMNLLIGPPADPGDVERMMALFFSKEGKHIVCGGTTSSLAAGYLGESLDADLDGYIDPDIPPIARVKGIDLVTEGIVTINRTLFYAQDYLAENKHYMDWSRKKDGASLLARMLFEDATNINVFIGKAINPAHQNPDLPIGFSIKMRLVEELVECLRKMGKRVNVSYF